MTSMNSTNLVRAHCRNCSPDDPCQLFELNNATSVENSCVCGHQRRDHIVFHLNPVTGRLEPLPGVEHVTVNTAPTSTSSLATIYAPSAPSSLATSGVPSAPSMDILLQALVCGQLGRFINNNANNTVAGSSNNSSNNNNNNRQTRKRSLPQQQGLGRRVLPVLAAGPSDNSSSSTNAATVLSAPPFSPSAAAATGNSGSTNSNVLVAGDVGAPGQSLTALDVEAMAAVEMANAFPSIYTKRKALFYGVVVLLPGTTTIPSNNSNAMKALVERGLATRRGAQSRFTLYGSCPDEYRPTLLGKLPLLNRLHNAGVSYDFVRRGGSGNAIDEGHAGNYHNGMYPVTLSELVLACNRPNVGTHYVHLRLREPFDRTLLDTPHAENATVPALPTITNPNAESITTNFATPFGTAVTAATASSAVDDLPPATEAAAIPFEDQDLWDPFVSEITGGQETVDLTGEAPSDTPPPMDHFTLAAYRQECFPECLPWEHYDIFANMEGPFFPAVLQQLSTMTARELHTSLKVHLESEGGGASLACDVGGVTRHYFYRAFHEATRCTMGTMHRSAFTVGDDGRWFPSSFPFTLGCSDFWEPFGQVLYFAFVNGTWMASLHPAVTKYLLNYKVGAQDLLGYSAAYDTLLAEDANPAAIDRELAEFNACAGDHAIPEGSTVLQHKQHALARTVLHDRPLPALMAIKNGFMKRAHSALVTGGITFPPLDLSFFTQFTSVARTADDILGNTSEDTDRDCPVYRVWEAAVRCLNTKEITNLMAWMCGIPTLPPKEPLKLQLVHNPAQQGNLPCAHVCHYTVDLSATKYVAPLCPTFEAGVGRLVSDLRFCLENANEMSSF